MNDRIKVCVIGAGAAGLCAARHFSRLPQLFTVAVIEQTASIADTWATTNFLHNDKYEYSNLKHS